MGNQTNPSARLFHTRWWTETGLLRLTSRNEPLKETCSSGEPLTKLPFRNLFGQRPISFSLVCPLGLQYTVQKEGFFSGIKCLDATPSFPSFPMRYSKLKLISRCHSSPPCLHWHGPIRPPFPVELLAQPRSVMLHVTLNQPRAHPAQEHVIPRLAQRAEGPPIRR